MSSTSVHFDVPVTYGHLRKPRRQGLFGLPMLASIALVLCLLLMVVIQLFAGLLWALGWAVAVVFFSAVLVIPGRDGRSSYQRLSLSASGRRARRRKENLVLAGPAGRAPDGKCRLPGLLAASELTEHVDPFGQPFALLRVPSTNHYTVVIDCHPTGDALVDQRQINSQVAHWGGWLANLGTETGIEGASVSIETAPDSGVRLRRAAAQHLAEDAPDFAVAVLDEITNTYPTGSAQIQTRCTVTFSGAPEPGARPRTAEEVAADIATRLPALIGGLRATGAGTTVRACRAQDVVDATRVAYDPSVALAVEEARGEGGTGLSWDVAGPVYAQETKEVYAHDRAYSMSWHMAEPPRGIFYDTTLKRLLQPHRGIDRKRVTILYRPVDSARAAKTVEDDLNAVTFNSSQRHRMSGRDRLAKRSAEKAVDEEARGAGLVRFGMIVTATVTDPDHLPLAARTVRDLAAPARLRLRPALWNQAVAFAAGLPLGVVLPNHMVLPAGLRDAL